MASPLPPGTNSPNGLALGDLDGDTVPALLAFTGSQVLCLHGDKTGAFAPWSTTLTADLVAQDLGASAALLDLNHDSNLDLVEADLHTTRVFLRQ